MENATNNRPPLRGMGNKVRDLYNTYVRNEEEYDNNEKQHINETATAMNSESAMNMDETTTSESNKRLIDLEKENSDLRDQLLRKSAEMENMRRRLMKEMDDLTMYANQRLLVQILPLIDDLQKALEAAKKSSDFQSLFTGLDMILQKSLKILNDSGVKPIESNLGDPFNVDLHEALAHLPSDMPADHIIQEIQKGYAIHEKVLRYAKVITSAGQTNE